MTRCSWFVSLVLLLVVPCAHGAAQDTQADVQRCTAMQHGDPKAAIALAQALLGRADLLTTQRLRALACAGMASAIAGDPKTANRMLADMGGLLEDASLSLPERIQAYAAMSGMLQALGNGERALSLLQRGYELAKGDNSGASELIVLDNLALIHAGLLNDNTAAEPFFEQAVTLAAGLDRELALRHYNHGLNLIHLQRYADALAALDRAAEMVGENPAQQGLRYRIQSNRSDVLLARGERTRARADLSESIIGQHRLGDAQGESVSRIKLADMDLAAGQREPALASALEALRLADQGSFPSEQIDALKLLTRIHTAMAQPSQALATLQRQQAIEIDRLRNQNLASLAALQAQLSDEAGARQIERLQLQNDVQSLKAHREKTVRNAMVGLLIAVLVGGGLFAVYQNRVHRRLRQLSMFDPLTGLMNRREMTARLAGGSPSTISAGTVLLIDADRFKAINDRHGHDVGDRVLTEVSARLLHACHGGELLSRWGGEEFLVVSPTVDSQDASRLAERLRSAVADPPLELADGTSLRVTVSIGYAPFPFVPGDPSTTWRDAIRLADRALYAVKRSTRDAWAGLWGKPHAAAIDLQRLQHDLPHAAAVGWIDIVSDKPLVWQWAENGA